MIDAEFRDAHRISPSQVETKRLCLRKWGLEKLDRVPKPENKYASRGTDCHFTLEGWQRDGKEIDFTTDTGKIVSSGLKFLPRPGTHIVEHNFVFRTERATYHGKMDLRGVLASPIQVVWDHKTTTSFKWLKPPEVLRRDPQANIYASAAIAESKENGVLFERVEQNWVYYLADPDKPKSRKVQLHVLANESVRKPVRDTKLVKPEHFGIMYLPELQDRFGEIEEDAVELLQLYHDKPKAMELPYNAAACSAYGGCPYKNNPCKLTMSERIISMEAQTAKTSLADKMRAKLGMGGSTAPADKPAASEEPKRETAPAAKPEAKATRMDPAAGTSKVNPPEQSKGVDPDAPATTKATQPGAVGVSAAFGRTEIATHMASALVASRVYSPDDNRYPVKVANEAVQLADALLAALAK